MNRCEERVLARKRRHKRVRKKIYGTPDCPRLSVFRSNRHIYAQIINDLAGNTLISASTMEKESESKIKGSNNIEKANMIGRILAKRAKDAKIERVVFDRGGFLYHGQVKALAEGAREEGLNF
ncbi:MAG: 50S ribosomal protein L18 [Nitrospirota bacterium]